MPRQEKTEQQKARRIFAARLIVIFAFLFCAGILLFEWTEYALSFRRESVSVSASSVETVRVLPDESEDRININDATAVDLQAVSGIGPELSRRVIEMREERGGFHFLEELKDVSGIGDKRFDALKGSFFCPPPAVQPRGERNADSF